MLHELAPTSDQGRCTRGRSRATAGTAANNCASSMGTDTKIAYHLQYICNKKTPHLNRSNSCGVTTCVYVRRAQQGPCMWLNRLQSAGVAATAELGWPVYMFGGQGLRKSQHDCGFLTTALRRHASDRKSIHGAQQTAGTCPLATVRCPP